MSIVHFVENGEQADAAAALSPGARVIALTPEAWLHAETRGGAHAILEDCYDEWLLGELREPILRAELDWIAWLDGELAAQVPQLADLQTPVARLWTYCLKRLIDQMTLLGFVVDQALTTLRPSEVVFAAPEAKEPHWETFFRVGPLGRTQPPNFTPSHVGPLVAAARGIRCRVLPAGARAQRSPRRRGLLVPALARRLLPVEWWDEIELFRSVPRSRKITLAARRLIARGERVLAVRGGYDLNPLIRRAAERGVVVDFWSRVARDRALSDAEHTLCLQVTDACGRLWPDLSRDRLFQAPFRHNDIDTFPLVRSGLEHFVARVISDTLRQFLMARRAIAARSYRAVLAPAGMRSTLLLHAARVAGIPSVIYQHGGFVGVCEQMFWDLTDLMNCDYHYVYGEGMRAYFRERAARYPQRTAEIVVTGSARLESVSRPPPARKLARLRDEVFGARAALAVLYVPTKPPGYARALVADTYPETAYWRMQAGVADVMKRFLDVSFVYKSFSDVDDNFIRRVLTHKGVGNCRLVNDVPLPRLLHAADLIVQDSPSTALLEAVLTDKPIVVYIDRALFRLQPAADRLLRRRAVIAETAAAFYEAIGRAIQDMTAGGGSARELNDPEFARAFALNASAGSATDRAWEHLDGLLHARPSIAIGPVFNS